MYEESCSTTNFGFEFKMSVVRLDDSPRDREAQPYSRNLVGGQMRAPEWFKDMGALIKGYADPLIGNSNDGFMRELSQTDFDVSAFGRILDRVADEIVQDLLNAQWVAVQHHGPVRHAPRHLMRGRKIAKQFKNPFNQRARIPMFGT